ncbi:MAG: tail fiber protein [Spirochaetales bacterium]|nr:tail fiber protein [Spirochaetales bacterium]
MAVKIQISGQDKVAADVITVGMITLISDVTKIYNGADWMTCDGSAVSRTVYEDLFAVIGTRFGEGDGVNTFNLPNANPTLVTGSYTFAAFLGDTVVSAENTSPAGIDISAGAVKDGTRLTIIHKSGQTLSIVTGEDMVCDVASEGNLILMWDGSQWCVILKTMSTIVPFSSNDTFKAPFATNYAAAAIGGGGGGGGSSPNMYGAAFGGGGGGGYSGSFSKYEPAGTPFIIEIGGGGAASSPGGNGGNGGTSTITDGVATATGNGGVGGSAGVATQTTVYGAGGAVGGQTGSGNSSGAGGSSYFGPGAAAVSPTNNGNAATNPSTGGSGSASAQNSSMRSGGAGASGGAYISY